MSVSPVPETDRARSPLEHILSARPPLGGSALLGFTVYALVVSVLPDVWLTWDLPNPQVWTAAFLVLLLLHAERPETPRGAWLELWCAAAVLTTMHAALLVWSRWDPVVHISPNQAHGVPWLIVWCCVLALVGLLAAAAHRYRTTTRMVAAVLAVLLVVLMTGQLYLQTLEAVFGVLLCLHTALLAVRRQKGPEPGAVLTVLLWLAVLLFAAFTLLNHPRVFLAYRGEVSLVTTLLSWGCLGLLTGAVLVRARQVTLVTSGATQRDQ